MRLAPPQIYFMNADGSGMRRLARGATVQRTDRQAARGCPGPSARMVARRAEDRFRQRAGRQRRDVPDERRRERATEADTQRGVGRLPDWSPDGTKNRVRSVMATARARSVAGDHVMNADGSGERCSRAATLLSGRPRAKDRLPKRPRRQRRDLRDECRRQRAAAVDARIPASDGEHVWSPDGRKIAFVGAPGGTATATSTS